MDALAGHSLSRVGQRPIAMSEASDEPMRGPRLAAVWAGLIVGSWIGVLGILYGAMQAALFVLRQFGE